MFFCFVFCHSVQEQIGNHWFHVFTRSYLSSLLNIYLWTNTKEFFVKKKFLVANMFAQKLMVNNEQCIVEHSPRFCKQYFVRRKNGFIPYSSCLQIVYSGLQCCQTYGFIRTCTDLLSSEKKYGFLYRFQGKYGFFGHIWIFLFGFS